MTSAPTQETTTRMRAGQHRARILLGADADPGATATEAWGWQGRTLGTSVIANDQTAWLRLASDPHHYSTFWWDGPSQATTLPRALPRPRLHATCSWTDDHWRYRAELFDRAPNAISPTLVITHDPDLPAAWWEQLRDALHTLANTPTPRIAVQQQYLDHAMPRLLGTPINTRSLAPWTTCHGDLHFANLIGPDLLMLDWEGWGMAPAGYDAARLHATCLLRPATAALVREELAEFLDTPAGRHAELVVITELLHNLRYGTATELTAHLRSRAAQVLGRPVPTPASLTELHPAPGHHRSDRHSGGEAVIIARTDHEESNR